MPEASPTVLRRPITHDIDHIRRHVGSWEQPAMLEGGSGLGIAGRWSILAARPRLMIESTTGRDFWLLADDGLKSRIEDEAINGLAEICRFHRLADPRDQSEPDAPPFQGGLVGFLGYDLAPRLERLPRRVKADSGMPVLRFALHDTFVAVDHQAGTSEVWAVDLLGEGRSAVRTRLDRWLADLDLSPPDASRRTFLTREFADVTREGYQSAVTRALEYIRAGDVFQVNLSQRFGATGEVDPFELYEALRASSPAPYAAYLEWGAPLEFGMAPDWRTTAVPPSASPVGPVPTGQTTATFEEKTAGWNRPYQERATGLQDLAILGASPELFFQVSGDRIVTRPIKGTRPRSADSVEDHRLAEELRSSVKDRAELTMIVDLERNDLGRICQFGSVRVADAWAVESFEHVHHLVATVEGRLKPGTGIEQVIRALFPGGSITGAPKIRAMEIIDELEPNRRSVYTGAVGFFGRCGQSAFNIAIRTMLVEGNRVSYQVGGGIVADSRPPDEYLETLDKARGMRQVLDQFQRFR